MEDIRHSAIFEMYTGGYILAGDNGYFTVGDVRDERTYVSYYDHVIVT